MHVSCLSTSDVYLWTGVEYMGLLETNFSEGLNTDLKGCHWVPLGTSESETPAPSNAVDG